jgi:hypothetical protein
MESVFAEPLNTEDALERYQQVALKVTHIVISEGSFI